MRVTWTKYVVASLALAACGPTIPKELVNARSAYRTVSSGEAARAVPDETERARSALSRAEDSYRDHGATPATRELSLAAEREAVRAQLTCAQKGSGVVAVTDWNADLGRINAALTAVPGTVMFEYDKAELLPAGKQRLDQLADALVAAKQADHAQPIIIEGYADAKGDASYNKTLSERRAHAVRDYLTSRGFDANLVQVRAMGESQPFTSNATAEGRANNRRVEILLAPKKGD